MLLDPGGLHLPDNAEVILGSHTNDVGDLVPSRALSTCLKIRKSKGSADSRSGVAYIVIEAPQYARLVPNKGLFCC
jgi:hypothetical protein